MEVLGPPRKTETWGHLERALERFCQTSRHLSSLAPRFFCCCDYCPHRHLRCHFHLFSDLPLPQDETFSPPARPDRAPPASNREWSIRPRKTSSNPCTYLSKKWTIYFSRDRKRIGWGSYLIGDLRQNLGLEQIGKALVLVVRHRHGSYRTITSWKHWSHNPTNHELARRNCVNRKEEDDEDGADPNDSSWEELRAGPTLRGPPDPVVKVSSPWEKISPRNFMS